MELLKFLAKNGVIMTDEVKEQVRQAQAKFNDDFIVKSELECKIAEMEVYKEEVEKLKSDKTKLNESLKASNEEFNNFKIGLEKEKANNVKTSLIKQGFEKEGLRNEKLIELLLTNMDLDAIEVKDNEVSNFSKIIEPIKNDYKDFFGTVSNTGQPPVETPPTEGKAFDISNIQNMSTEEINANWETISKSLGGN